MQTNLQLKASVNVRSAERGLAGEASGMSGNDGQGQTHHVSQTLTTLPPREVMTASIATASNRVQPPV